MFNIVSKLNKEFGFSNLIAIERVVIRRFVTHPQFPLL